MGADNAIETLLEGASFSHSYIGHLNNSQLQLAVNVYAKSQAASVEGLGAITVGLVNLTASDYVSDLHDWMSHRPNDLAKMLRWASSVLAELLQPERCII